MVVRFNYVIRVPVCASRLPPVSLNRTVRVPLCGSPRSNSYQSPGGMAAPPGRRGGPIHTNSAVGRYSTVLVASESFPKVSFSGYCTMAEALSHATRAERVASRAHGSSEAVGEHSIPAVVPPATPSHRLTRGESALRVRRNGMRGTRAGPTQTTKGQTLAGGA